MIITGSKFVLQSDLKSSEYFVQLLTQAFTAQFVIFIFLVLIFFIFGLTIIRKRNCHFTIYICFGVCVLFFGFILNVKFINFKASTGPDTPDVLELKNEIENLQ